MIEIRTLPTYRYIGVNLGIAHRDMQGCKRADDRDRPDLYSGFFHGFTQSSVCCRKIVWLMHASGETDLAAVNAFVFRSFDEDRADLVDVLIQYDQYGTFFTRTV